MKNMKEKLSAKLKKKNGFTLIEMLVVVAIIVILVLVSIPMVTNSLESAREATDKANLRAAKAEAAIEYLTEKIDASKTYYYDADKGSLETNSEGIKGYGQSKANKDKVITVTIAENGEITCSFPTPTPTPAP